MFCVSATIMSKRLHIALILGILFSLPPTLRAQENKEAEHACYRLNEERISQMEMKIQGDCSQYKSQFKYRKEWSDKQVFVRIPALITPYSLFINSSRFGSDPGSGIPSEYNITPFLNKQSNFLELHSDSVMENNETAAIDASLMIRNAVHIRNLLISSHEGKKENETLVRFHLYLKSYQEGKKLEHSISLEVSYQGEELLNETRKLSSPLSFGQETEMIIDLPVRDPVYWFPGAPSYYEVKISMKESGQEDQEMVSSLFDFRSCQIKDSLFIQKGDSILLVYASEDLASLLPGLPEQEISGIVEKLGINAIRRETPFPCTLEDLFLRMGILVTLISE